MVEQADTPDSKSGPFGGAGSIPALGTSWLPLCSQACSHGRAALLSPSGRAFHAARWPPSSLRSPAPWVSVLAALARVGLLGGACFGGAPSSPPRGGGGGGGLCPPRARGGGVGWLAAGLRGGGG